MRPILIIVFLFFGLGPRGLAADDDLLESKIFKSTWGKRNYQFFVPSTVRPLSTITPLVVMLHGCLQDARDFMGGSEMNELARTYRFSVLYPEQSRDANKMNCWNWYETVNQRRDDGEALLLVELVREILKQHPFINKRRVYLAGLSAGGAMASNLATCYPELFAGAAIHSGLGFKFAYGEGEAQLALEKGAQHDLKQTAELAKKCSPENHELVPTMIIHGTKDDVTKPVNGEQILSQLLLVAGLEKNSSLLDQEKDLGKGKDTYAYNAELYGDPERDILIERVEIRGLEHAWSGGNARYKFTDGNMPKSSELVWKFFSEIGLPIRSVSGVSVDGTASGLWLSAIKLRLSEEDYARISVTKKVMTEEEKRWMASIKTLIPRLINSTAKLKVPFEGLDAPNPVRILFGNQGGDDAFVPFDDMIAIDLSAWVKLYGKPGDAGNVGRAERILFHEYTHILHRAWKNKYAISEKTPFDRALWESFYEGIGNYRSLSEAWLPVDGDFSPKAAQALKKLSPVFVDQMIALDRIQNPEKERDLRQNLSSGKFEEKWGALPVALWLAMEANGDDKKLVQWVDMGPKAVLTLAKKYLPKDLWKKFEANVRPKHVGQF